MSYIVLAYALVVTAVLAWFSYHGLKEMQRETDKAHAAMWADEHDERLM